MSGEIIGVLIGVTAAIATKAIAESVSLKEAAIAGALVSLLCIYLRALYGAVQKEHLRLYLESKRELEEERERVRCAGGAP